METAGEPLFGCSGGQAADQLRSPAALEGALSRPMYHAHYAGADIALQAAVLCHGIAESQPFIDGNKRTALAAMLTFLRANDVHLAATEAELASWVLDLSEGLTPEQLGELLREHTVLRSR